MHRENSHARYAQHAANKLGMAFEALDGPDAYLFEVRHGDRVCRLAAGPCTPYVKNTAAGYTIARDKTFTAQVLQRAGVPCLSGALYFIDPRQRALRAPGREIEDALRDARGFSYPVFCKPNDGCRGAFARQVNDEADFRAYIDAVVPLHAAIVVQPVVRGTEHRVFVLDGEALFSYRKQAAATPGQQATPLNRAAGGSAADLQTRVPEGLARIAVRAADALGLGLAGVDVFDLGPEAGHRVIEVNANPRIETLEDLGRWDLIEAVWTRNLLAAFA